MFQSFLLLSKLKRNFCFFLTSWKILKKKCIIFDRQLLTFFLSKITYMQNFFANMFKSAHFFVNTGRDYGTQYHILCSNVSNLDRYFEMHFLLFLLNFFFALRKENKYWKFPKLINLGTFSVWALDIFSAFP